MSVEQLPAVGIAGVLVLVIAYLLTSNHRDRVQYERALAVRDVEHAADLSAARAAHDADLAGLRARLAALERRLTELEVELDQERKRRRAAEDKAAAARRARH